MVRRACVAVVLIENWHTHACVDIVLIEKLHYSDEC